MLLFDSEPLHRRGYLPAAHVADWPREAAGRPVAVPHVRNVWSVQPGAGLAVARPARAKDAPRARVTYPAHEAALRREAAARAKAEVTRHAPPREGRRMHCIVDGPPGRALAQLIRGAETVLGTRVVAISEGPYTAVVSEGPARRRRRGTDASAHELVMDAASRDHTVIPFAFESLVGSDQEIHELLRGARTELGELVEAIRGKVELALVVRWDREQIVAEIERESDEVKALRARIVEARRGPTYWERLQLARTIESALEQRVRTYVSEVRAALRESGVGVRCLSSDGDEVVLACALLVEHACVDGLVHRIERLAASYAGRLTFERSGPRPPSSFVTMKLRLESAS